MGNIPSQITMRPGQSADSRVSVASKTGLSIEVQQVFNGLRMIRFKLVNVSIATTDAGASGAYGSQKLCDLPEALVVSIGGVSDLSFEAASGIGASGVLKHAVGSAAEATNDTLDSTQANIIPSTSLTLASSAGSKTGVSTAVAFIDGHTTAGAVFLNLGIADADSSGNSTVTVSGTIDLVLVPIGDGAN